MFIRWFHSLEMWWLNFQFKDFNGRAIRTLNVFQNIVTDLEKANEDSKIRRSTIDARIQFLTTHQSTLAEQEVKNEVVMKRIKDFFLLNASDPLDEDEATKEETE